MTTAKNIRTRNKKEIAEEAMRRGGVCACGCGMPLENQYHWHHRSFAGKLFNISDMRNGATLVTLRAELAKCEPLLARCHLEGRHGH